MTDLEELLWFRTKENDEAISGKKGLYRIKEIRAGNRKIVKCYPVRADYTNSRHKQGKSRSSQRILNDKNRQERFHLLFLNNFREGDMYVSLTFKDSPKDKDAALEKLKGYIRKLRACSDQEIRYLGVVETLNVDGEEVRCHIHLIISGTDFDTVRKKWTWGNADIQSLRKDYETVGDYLSKTFSQIHEGEHRYTRSRNLKEPEVTTKTLNSSFLPDSEELDAIFLHTNEYAAEFFPEYELTNTPEIRRSDYVPGFYIKLELTLIDKKRRKITSYYKHLAAQILPVLAFQTG